jgi:hypothetical protein
MAVLAIHHFMNPAIRPLDPDHTTGRLEECLIALVGDPKSIQFVFARRDVRADAERLLGSAVRINKNDDLAINPDDIPAPTNDPELAPDGRGHLYDALDVGLRSSILGMRYLKNSAERGFHRARLDTQKIMISTRPLHFVGAQRPRPESGSQLAFDDTESFFGSSLQHVQHLPLLSISDWRRHTSQVDDLVQQVSSMASSRRPRWPAPKAHKPKARHWTRKFGRLRLASTGPLGSP